MNPDTDHDEDIHVEFIDGKYVDTNIELLLTTIYAEDYDKENFNVAFTNMVRTYIYSDCAPLVASHAGRDKANCGVLHYLSYLGLDYMVIHPDNGLWPEGGFPNMPDATTAMSIFFPDGTTMTDHSPGTSINQATLMAIVEYARQIAHEAYNGPDVFPGISPRTI